METSKLVFVVAMAGLSLGAAGCKKDGEGGGGGASASGCGADYADPNKEFCIAVPAGYTAQPPSPPDTLYSEVVSFNGPMSGFTVTVGFSSSNWKTFDDQLKSDDSFLSKKPGVTSGTIPGGKWWAYNDRGTDEIRATVKSNGNKAIACSPNNTVVKPEVIAACKSIRAYPK